VDGALLEASLLELNYLIRGEPVKVALSPAKASDARDALSKALYGALFDALVSRANEAMRPPPVSTPTGKTLAISILDIFGFEIFEKNSFEQLCINFANEKLQQHFNDNTFKLEEELYASEQVPFEPSKYIDSQVVLDLIEKKPSGLLVILDEELKYPKATDETFLSKAKKAHNGSPRFDERVKGGNGKTQFLLRHYAGDVSYEAMGFLDKNKDRLYDDLEACMGSSGSAYLRGLFPQPDNASGGVGGGGGGASSKRETQGGRFKRQLGSLMASLAATEPQYIRCIKANSLKKPDLFEAPLCLQQLRYSGVFEAVAIRKQGFPFRLTHEQWFKEYRPLAPDATPGIKQRDWAKACDALLGAIAAQHPAMVALDEGGNASVHIGQTRVLYRAPVHRALTLYRNLALERSVQTVQRFGRGLCGRRRAVEMRRVAALLDAAVAARSQELLRAALGQHVPMQVLGGPGLWRLLPRRASLAAAVLRSLDAEEAVRSLVAATPPPEDHAEAAREFEALVATVAACRGGGDLQAFTGAEFAGLLNGQRVVAGAVAGLTKVASLPLVLDHALALEEWRGRVVACVDGCARLTGDAACFSAHAFVGELRAGSRVLAGATASLRDLAASPPLESFPDAKAEYDGMMAIVVSCRAELGDPSHSTGAEFLPLTRGDRVVAGAEASVRRRFASAAAPAAPVDAAAARSEFEELMATVSACLEMAPDTAFGAPDLLALRCGSRLAPACAALAAARGGPTSSASAASGGAAVDVDLDLDARLAELGAMVEFMAGHRAAAAGLSAQVFASPEHLAVDSLHAATLEMLVAKRGLAAAVEAFEKEALVAGLAAAAALTEAHGDFCPLTVAAAAQCLARIEEEEKLLGELALCTGAGTGPSGEPGSLSPPPEVGVAGLRAALARCAELEGGLVTAGGRQRAAEGAWLLELRESLAAALAPPAKAFRDPLWKAVEALLAAASDPPRGPAAASSEEVALVRLDLEQRGGVEATLEKLFAASEVLDESLLAAALALAARFKMAAHPDPSVVAAVASAAAAASEVARVKALLGAALVSLEDADFSAALDAASALGFGDPASPGRDPKVCGQAEVAEAVALRARVASCLVSLEW